MKRDGRRIRGRSRDKGSVVQLKAGRSEPAVVFSRVAA